MSVTATSFRAAFPAFASTTTYPDAMVNMWLTQALNLHNAARWDANLDFGVQLWTAHNLMLESAAVKKGSASGGVLSSKSVDGVSMSYDHSTSKVEGAGNWNMTTYGQRWYTLSQMAGMGPVQIGVPSASDATNSAWPGYIPPNF